jgi:hypothetical protein
LDGIEVFDVYSVGLFGFIGDLLEVGIPTILKAKLTSDNPPA